MATGKIINELTRRYVIITVGLCLMTMQTEVFAELSESETKTVTDTSYIIKPYVESSLTYDANLLRLPKNYTQLMSGNRTKISDFIKQAKAGAKVKWQISQQELIADISVNRNWFDNFTEFDYTGYNLLGQWNWKISSRLSGELAYNHNLNLAGFQQINRLVSNLLNREKYSAKGAYEFLPHWFLRAAYIHDDFRYPSELRKQSSLIEKTKLFALRYAFEEPENLAEFYVALADGKYPERDETSQFDNQYSRITYAFRAMWNYSAKTRFRAEIGYLSQEFLRIKTRNFSDIIANADILWEPTVKSKLYLEVWRNISSVENLAASFSLNQGVRFTPTWTWSERPKIQIELPTTYEQQSYLGSAIDASRLAQTASQFSVRLNLNYEPIPNIRMTAFAVYENRSSNVVTSSYQDQLVGITVQGSF